jgi:hypothetical protein
MPASFKAANATLYPRARPGQLWPWNETASLKVFIRKFYMKRRIFAKDAECGHAVKLGTSLPIFKVSPTKAFRNIRHVHRY